MKFTHFLPFSGRSRVFLSVFVLLLVPVFGSLAQESPASPAPESRRPLEESLLILDSEEQTEASEAQEVAEGPLVSSWDFLRMVLILAAVVGVIYLIFWLLKRGLRRQLPQNDLIQLLGTRNLSGNRALHLVELGKQVFLVGAAEGSISLISEIRNQETLDSIALERSQMQARTPQGFANFLKSFLTSGKRSESSVGATIDFMKQQRQRLEKL
ncbi:MAG: flagellar biosynthetic protein FliO [Spirochaetaceae bacterium]|nr:MAG: flagellar biosynthetic protein FliO [Spirochaetaceae bacterium]